MRVVIVLAEGGRDVHDAGTGIERHEIFGDYPPPERVVTTGLERHARFAQRLLVKVERRTVTLADQLARVEATHDGQLVADLFRERRAQATRDDQLGNPEFPGYGWLFALD